MKEKERNWKEKTQTQTVEFDKFKEKESHFCSSVLSFSDINPFV